MAGKKLVIIGGVAGGATAAARARRLSEDVEIVVLERGPHISFANCGLPYHLSDEIPARKSLILQTPERMKDRYNVDVRTQHEVTEIDRDKKQVVVNDLQEGRSYREDYDNLIISTGAAPIRPPLPGIDSPRILTLRNIPDMDAIRELVDKGAENAIVIGGGFIGLEVAENLAHREVKVHLVEMLDQVMPPLDREMAQCIHKALADGGVSLHLSDAVESFKEVGDQVEATLKSGTKLKADMVVLAIGVRPDSGLAQAAGLEMADRGGIRVNEHMLTSDPNIYAVGDAVTVSDYVTGADALIPLAGPANRQGRIAADNIMGRTSAYRGTQGTSIVRVFDQIVGMTGANEKTLKRLGTNYEKVYAHPANHVGYYPGAENIATKLLFSKDDGRILGAQLSGKAGVDKRVDVLAVAIQAGMTVYDLEETELAYSPPFGAAKDPVNMAGFVASNLLRGDTTIVHADELDGHMLLDIREPKEVEAGAIPGATFIPLDQLRSRLSELPKDKPIAVYCKVGLRGYLAVRILKQNGFDARNLSGGYLTYLAYYPPE